VWAPPSRRHDSIRCHCGDHIRCNGLLGTAWVRTGYIGDTSDREHG
jgi:hypothetical protein